MRGRINLSRFARAFRLSGEADHSSDREIATDTQEVQEPTQSNNESEVNYSPIIAQLQSENNQERYEAVLQVVAITKEGKRSLELARLRVIPILVELLGDKQNGINLRVSVAAALCNLSRKSKCHPSFSACEAVHTLVGYVILDHQVLTAGSALMLSYLIRSQSLIQQMLDCNVMPVLLQGLMKCTGVEIGDTVVRSLQVLCTKKVLKDSLISSRGVEVCRHFLHNYARSHYLKNQDDRRHQQGSDRPPFVDNVPQETFIQLMTGHQNSGTGDAGPSSPLSDVPEISQRNSDPCDDDFTPRKVGYIVRRLSATPIQPEVQYFRMIGSADWGRSPRGDVEQDLQAFRSSDMPSVERYLSLLGVLLGGSQEATDIFICGGPAVDVIVYWLEHGSDMARLLAMRVLRQLLRQGHHQSLTRQDVIQQTVSILSEERDPEGPANDFKRSAAQTIFEVCSTSENAARMVGIVSHDILQDMVERLLDIVDDETQVPRLTFTALRALDSVVKCEPLQMQLAEAGGLEKLMDFVHSGLIYRSWEQERPRSPRSPSDQASGYPSPQTVFEYVPGVSSCLDKAARDTSHRMRSLEYSSALLASFTATNTPGFVNELIALGIIPTMLEAARQDFSMMVKKHALRALVNLCSLQKSQVDLCQEGVCDLLFDLRDRGHARSLHDPDQWVAWCSKGLYNLLRCRESRRYVLDAASRFWGEDRKMSVSDLRSLFRPDKHAADKGWIVKV